MRLSRALLGVTLGSLVFVAGCSGASKGSETPTSEPALEPEPVPDSPPPSDSEPESTPAEAPSAAAEPAFQPGMSVAEATAAVPPGTDRVEIEQEVLVAPLMKTELYAPCSLKGNQRFFVKIAIWDGRVVGLDLETQPKNATVDACLRRQIEGLTWKKKAKSLSTVEFNY